MKSLLFVVLFCVINRSFTNKMPDYLDVCKRDQNTIDNCVLKSIQKLRPKLAQGIPELNVPGIEPFIIPELVVDSGDLVQFSAVGRDVKVSGAGNFSIKTISVDLDTYTIRAMVRFPKLHFDGHYTLDARLLVLPLHGKGKIIADAIKCDAEMLVRATPVEKNGKEYLHFDSADMDITVKDYRLKLDGLFNGDKALGQAANEAINQNRAEFLRASKPYLEKTVSKLILNMANKISGTFPLEDLLPK